jgi:hypothetical protein
MTRCDTRQLFRLDLEKRMVAALKSDIEPLGDGNRGKLFRFSTSESDRYAPPYFRHRWLADGSAIVSMTQKACFLLKRVK